MKGRRGNYKKRVRKGTRSTQIGKWIYEHWITDSEGVQTVYVGLTERDPWTRFEEHKEMAREGSKTPFHAALREANYQTRMEIRKHETAKEMAKDEVDSIAKYKAEGQPVYNKTKGGEVAKGIWKYNKEGHFKFVPKRFTWQGRLAWRKKRGS